MTLPYGQRKKISNELMPKVVHVPWTDLHKSLGVEYICPSESNIREAVSHQGNRWIDGFETQNTMSLTAEERQDIIAALHEMARNHWSIGSVLSHHLDVDSLVGTVNEWSNRGSTSGAADRIIPRGDGILDWKETRDGLAFTIAPPFLSAYIDARHCTTGEVDDGIVLRDVDSSMVTATLRGIFDCEERPPLSLDLSGWDEFRSIPAYDTIVKCMESLRSRFRSKPRREPDDSDDDSEEEDLG